MGIIEALMTIFLVSLGIVTLVALICTIRDVIKSRKTVDTRIDEHMGYTIPFSDVPVPNYDQSAVFGEVVYKKKWVTPHVVEVRLEFTGIRAIQL